MKKIDLPNERNVEISKDTSSFLKRSEAMKYKGIIFVLLRSNCL
jgi:hypothetical protein